MKEKAVFHNETKKQAENAKHARGFLLSIQKNKPQIKND